MTALKEELINYISDIPDEKLVAIQPLLRLLSDSLISLEDVDFNDLDDDEKEAVIKGRKEYESGDCVDFTDYLNERY